MAFSTRSVLPGKILVEVDVTYQCDHSITQAFYTDDRALAMQQLYAVLESGEEEECPACQSQ